MITRSIFARCIFAAGMVSGSLLAAEISTQISGAESPSPLGTPSSPVTRQEVWQAVVAELRERGQPERQLPRVEDIDLPVALPALAGRKLRVLSSCRDAGPRRTQFRLECGAPGQCLPFLAYLRNYVRGHVRDDVNADPIAPAASCRLASGPHPAPEVSPKPAPQSTVRAGDPATSVFVAGRLRLTARVTCLERGREGAVIRVRSQDGHIFRARISGPALLEALPRQ